MIFCLIHAEMGKHLTAIGQFWAIRAKVARHRPISVQVGEKWATYPCHCIRNARTSCLRVLFEHLLGSSRAAACAGENWQTFFRIFVPGRPPRIPRSSAGNFGLCPDQTSFHEGYCAAGYIDKIRRRSLRAFTGSSANEVSRIRAVVFGFRCGAGAGHYWRQASFPHRGGCEVSRGARLAFSCLGAPPT